MSWIAELPGNLPRSTRRLHQPTRPGGVEELNDAISFGSSALTQVQEEAISTVVSVANHCRY